MKILRVFNNNVVLAEGPRGEVIATGRGVGFQAKAGQEVDAAKVHRVFVPSDGRDPDHMGQLLAEIPLEYVTLLTDAIAAAGLPESAATSPTLMMTLADHVHGAVLRIESGQHVDYPLFGEVRNLYAEEFSQAQRILRHVNDGLAANNVPRLPDAEAVALTLHLVNAGFSTGDLSFTYTMTGVLHQLIATIEEVFAVELDTSTVNVGRFITHLRYLFVRIQRQEQLQAEASAISDAIAHAHPEEHRCARQLARLLGIRMGAELTADEIAYLTLHIARIVTIAPPAPPRRTTGPEPVRRTAVVGSAIGLHARPAALLAEATRATGYPITLSHGEQTVDAGSVLEIMSLGAEHGDSVTLACIEPTAGAVLDALTTLITTDFSRDQSGGQRRLDGAEKRD